MGKRLLRSLVIGALLVSGAVAISTYARAQSGTGSGSSTTGSGSSTGSTGSQTGSTGSQTGSTGSQTGSTSSQTGSGSTYDTGTGGGADAGRKARDAGL
jgi:hypothetical protein